MDSTLISTMIPPETGRAPEPETPVSLKILVADDEPLMLELLGRTLRDLGHKTVGSAANGKEAVTLARQLRPDLIILDYAMPEMDGMEAAETIMKELSIPIVMSSGRTDDSTLQRARKAEIHSYLVKPFHRDQLKFAITMARARHLEKITAAAKIAELQDELAVVKAVDTAAALLMEKFRIDRRDAIEKLETAARARSCSLMDAAKAVTATLTPRPTEPQVLG